MADNSVYITGAVDGAFVDAMNGLPPWATEATAIEMEKYLRKSFDMQSKIFQQLRMASKGGVGTGSGNNQPKQVADELDKLARSLRRDNEENEKEKKRKKARGKQEDEELTRGKKLKTTGDKVDYIFGKIAIAGAALEDVYKRSFNVTDSLLESGINTTAGMDNVTEAGLSLQQAVRLTQLRFETLQKVAEKYTESINAVGFNKFAKTVSKTSDQLRQFGFSNEQQAELIGALIDSESNYSDIRSKTSQELADDAVRLGSQLSRLSLVMGISIEKMNQNILAFSKSTDATTVSAIWGEKAAQNLGKFTASFGDNKVAAELFQKLAATQNPILTKAYQDMAKAGQAGLADQMTRIAQYARDSGDAIGAQKQLEALALRTGSATFKALEVQASAGNEGARATLDTLTSVRQTATKISHATGAELDQATKDRAARAGLKTEIESAKATPDKTFALLNDQINLMTTGVNMFNRSVGYLNSLISPITASWIGAGVIVVGFIASLVAARGGLTTFASLLTGKSNIIGTAADSMISGIKNINGGLGSAAKNLGMLGAAAFAGYEVGTLLYEHWLQDSKTFQKGANATFGGLDSVLSALGSGDAKHRIEVQKKLEIEEKAWKNPKATTPVPSTINSPSAVSSTPAASNTSPPQAPDTQLASGTGIEKPGKNSDINSLLGYQASIMEQVLQTSTALLSVNKDILKFTRSHA